MITETTYQELIDELKTHGSKFDDYIKFIEASDVRPRFKIMLLRRVINIIKMNRDINDEDK